MTHAKKFLFAAAAAGLFSAAAMSQHLATYDPGSLRELATSACRPAPPMIAARNLYPRSPAALNLAGAVAADNTRQVLFSTTGWPADGIDEVAFSGIGTGTLAFNYAAPPGFNQITGMVVDPLDSTGQTLIVTDGYVLAPYQYGSSTYASTPQPIPLPTGRTATGLDYDIWTKDIVVVLDDATIMRVPVYGGSWTMQPPLFAAPSVATGVAICRSAPSTPMVSYFGGAVLDPLTGASQPFLGGGLLSPRRHRGMTFLAIPVMLGGSGSASTPTVALVGSFQAGSLSLKVEVDNTYATLLAIDLAPTATGISGLPMLDGTLFVNPATSVTVLQPAGQSSFQLDLSNATAGASVAVQAASLGSGVFHMSDALFFTTWL